MANGWVPTGQKAEKPFSDLAKVLESSEAKGFTRTNLDGIREAVESGRYGKGKKGARSFRSALMPSMVKGIGLMEAGQQFRQPLEDAREIERMSDASSAVLKAVTKKGLTDPRGTTKGFSGPLRAAVNALNAFSPQAVAGSLMANSWAKTIGEQIGKSFSLASPLSSGFVPFDLVPFVRTIFPVYTPMRDKLPRVPGQGEYHRGKILSQITGSLPGALGSLQDDSTSEFFGGSGFSEWPNPLPASGSQTAYDIIIPYKFYALTESTSWLAQFAGQGFDDIYGLSSLVLLQEFMLLEEHDILASTSQPLSVPATPGIAARSAGSNEKVLSGLSDTNYVFVQVAAVNYWGQTTVGTAAYVEWRTGDVVDVTISPVPAGLQYILYVTYGASDSDPGTYYQWTTGTTNGSIGAHKFTLQGALPSSGNSPSTVDTGTYSANRAESIISVLSGQAYNGGDGPYPDVSAGYYNASAGTIFNVATVQYDLQQMYNGPTGYFANPSEILTSANDATNLATSIQAETVGAYQLRVQQSEMKDVTAGIAVSSIVNPVTRSAPEIVIHPYLPQGTALYMSYTLPQTQNNLGNVVEMVMVQDYAQIGWPVIDPAFRQSILRYGTFFMPAPQYCGLTQGLQNSASTPYS